MLATLIDFLAKEEQIKVTGQQYFYHRSVNNFKEQVSAYWVFSIKINL